MTNAEKILKAMSPNEWYSPVELRKTTKVVKAATYLARLNKQGKVRKRQASNTNQRKAEYRRVV